MSQRRMFSQQIVDSDAFLDMPPTSQLLYFHLAMRADDDGFVDNPKKMMRVVGSGTDDLKILVAKRFLIQFENGVVVIKHWKIHNLIRADRYHETKYLKEKDTLMTKENGSYTEKPADWQPNGNQMATEASLGKVRLGEDTREQSSRLLEIPGIVRGSDYQPDGVSPRDVQAAKPKRERTQKQKAVLPILLIMDYFRDEVKRLHSLSYLHREEDRNAKVRKQIDSAYSRFQEETRLFVDWWLNGGGAWCNYEPEACFTNRAFREYENKDVIAQQPTKAKGKEVRRI